MWHTRIVEHGKITTSLPLENKKPNRPALQNWYGQAILIPQLCSTTCLLAKDGDLTEEQRAGCERIPLRSYVLRDERYGTGGYMTGANVSFFFFFFLSWPFAHMIRTGCPGHAEFRQPRALHQQRHHPAGRVQQDHG